jgi:CspA family cold shock protein
MAEGTVRWFNSEEGHGYIAPDGGGVDVYVHYSSIQVKGYKTLDELDRVSYAVEIGPEGLTAVKVTPLGVQGQPPPPPGAARQRRPWWRRLTGGG